MVHRRPGSLAADRRLGRQGEVLHQELGPRQRRLRPLRLQSHAVDPDFAGGSLVLSVYVNGADVGRIRDGSRIEQLEVTLGPGPHAAAFDEGGKGREEEEEE